MIDFQNDIMRMPDPYESQCFDKWSLTGFDIETELPYSLAVKMMG